MVNQSPELATGGQLVNDGHYPLHRLGWKAFQDLCVAVAEECLKRPVRLFLPVADGGRDGAFVGCWTRRDEHHGESTIQCKFTSKPNVNLTPSLLEDEFEKVTKLAAEGLADDYIILTNHPVTGEAEALIKARAIAVGVKTCVVYGYDWIVEQVRKRPRLRLMAPRLYGLGDLSDLFDERAYEQAQLILSSMADDIDRLVVTDAHRRSVKAVSDHGLVLLLGAPATGKSTIAASLALGAADNWNCVTLKATSAEAVESRLKPYERQFFWIDDAWGGTQYIRDTVESWNQVLPLMQAAMKRGTRFLITSRDYIWRAAKGDLKIHALPTLGKSQVEINVGELTEGERAQMLYNHLRMGAQPSDFRAALRPFLPDIVRTPGFLPESARRLADPAFTQRLPPTREAVLDFFERPEAFLLDTVRNLAPDCQAAVAAVFLSGGTLRSPVPPGLLVTAAEAFGAAPAAVRSQLGNLNGSLLLLAQDEEGSYWTYRHPTIADAFASFVAEDPELVELYLRGAKASSIASEVVCAGVTLKGAKVVVSDSLHPLLLDRFKDLGRQPVASFMTNRANVRFNAATLERWPELLDDIDYYAPISDDSDAALVAKLHAQGLLPEAARLNFVRQARKAALEGADASLLEDSRLGAVLTAAEWTELLSEAKTAVLGRIGQLIDRRREDWDKNTPPEDHFDQLKSSLKLFVKALADQVDMADLDHRLNCEISSAVGEMYSDFEPYVGSSSPTPQKTKIKDEPLAELFRDVHE